MKYLGILLLSLLLAACVMDEEDYPSDEVGLDVVGRDPTLSVTVTPVGTMPLCFEGKDCP
jgi:hypothetical protein